MLPKRSTEIDYNKMQFEIFLNEICRDAKNKGEMPIEYAIKNNFNEIAKGLIEYNIWLGQELTEKEAYQQMDRFYNNNSCGILAYLYDKKNLELFNYIINSKSPIVLFDVCANLKFYPRYNISSILQPPEKNSADLFLDLYKPKEGDTYYQDVLHKMLIEAAKNGCFDILEKVAEKAEKLSCYIINEASRYLFSDGIQYNSRYILPTPIKDILQTLDKLLDKPQDTYELSQDVISAALKMAIGNFVIYCGVGKANEENGEIVKNYLYHAITHLLEKYDKEHFNHDDSLKTYFDMLIMHLYFRFDFDRNYTNENAVKKNDMDMSLSLISQLTSKGAAFDKTFVLHYAAYGNNLPLCKQLLDKGADILAPKANGKRVVDLAKDETKNYLALKTYLAERISQPEYKHKFSLFGHEFLAKPITILAHQLNLNKTNKMLAAQALLDVIDGKADLTSLENNYYAELHNGRLGQIYADYCRLHIKEHTVAKMAKSC